MAATYTLIESYTVGSGGASSVTLGSGGTIPQTYTDLLIKWSSRDGFSDYKHNINVTYNGNTSSYSEILLYNDGTTPSSASRSSVPELTYLYSNGANSDSNTFSNFEMYIPNYTSSNYKSSSADGATERNATNSQNNYAHAGLWSNTAAITSITFTPRDSASFVQYSTFYLYGIKNS